MCDRYLIGGGIVGTFHEQLLQKTRQAVYKTEKNTLKKTINCMLNGKVDNNLFNSWFDKSDML